MPERSQSKCRRKSDCDGQEKINPISGKTGEKGGEYKPCGKKQNDGDGYDNNLSNQPEVFFQSHKVINIRNPGSEPAEKKRGHDHEYQPENQEGQTAFYFVIGSHFSMIALYCRYPDIQKVTLLNDMSESVWHCLSVSHLYRHALSPPAYFSK